MTNFPNGIATSDNYGITKEGAVTGASLSITGASTIVSAAVTGAITVGTLTIGGGDVINSIITYTSTATNIAAINAASYLEVAATVTGAVNADIILASKKTTLVAGLHIVGAQVSAISTVSVLLYNSTAGVINASSDTFKVTVKR